MKTIKVRKSTDFSENSKVYLHMGTKKVHLRGYESFSFNVNPGEAIYATQQWTSSNRVSYEQVEDQSNYAIRPRLGKKFAFINLVILLICFAIFYFTRSKWSFFPFIPSIIYIGLYISLLREKYLIIESYRIELLDS